MKSYESGLILPIRFYTQLDHQDRFKPNANGVTLTELNYPYVDISRLAPFQIVYQANDDTVSATMEIICVDTGDSIDVGDIMPYSEVYTDITNQLTYLSYKIENLIVGLNTNAQYYIKVTIEDYQSFTRYFYSDLFMCADTTITNMVKLEYWNTFDIMDINYSNSTFHNLIWLPVQIKKPEYIITREAYEDGLGESHNTWLKWEKQYQFNIMCTESLADALSAITMHNNVAIWFGGTESMCKDFTTETSWQNIDCIASVTATIVTDSYVVSSTDSTNCF